MAAALIGPDAGALLRDQHGPDERGRCRGCPHEVTVAPLFPCLLRVIGETAARVEASSVTTGDSADGRR